MVELLYLESNIKSNIEYYRFLKIFDSSSSRVLGHYLTYCSTPNNARISNIFQKARRGWVIRQSLPLINITYQIKFITILFIWICLNTVLLRTIGLCKNWENSQKNQTNNFPHFFLVIFFSLVCKFNWTALGWWCFKKAKRKYVLRSIQRNQTG